MLVPVSIIIHEWSVLYRIVYCGLHVYSALSTGITLVQLDVAEVLV